MNRAKGFLSYMLLSIMLLYCAFVSCGSVCAEDGTKLADLADSATDIMLGERQKVSFDLEASFFDVLIPVRSYDEADMVLNEEIGLYHVTLKPDEAYHITLSYNGGEDIWSVSGIYVYYSDTEGVSGLDEPYRLSVMLEDMDGIKQSVLFNDSDEDREYYFVYSGAGQGVKCELTPLDNIAAIKSRAKAVGVGASLCDNCLPAYLYYVPGTDQKRFSKGQLFSFNAGPNQSVLIDIGSNNELFIYDEALKNEAAAITISKNETGYTVTNCEPKAKKLYLWLATEDDKYTISVRQCVAFDSVMSKGIKIKQVQEKITIAGSQSKLSKYPNYIEAVFNNQEIKGALYTLEEGLYELRTEYIKGENDTQSCGYIYIINPTEGRAELERLSYGQVFEKTIKVSGGQKVYLVFYPNEDKCESSAYAIASGKRYTIKYYLGGGKNNAKNPRYYYVSDKTTVLKSPSKKGYTFAGWYADKAFKKKVTRIYSGSTGNIKLYAKWKPVKYKVVFKKNGATSGKMKTMSTLYYGKSYRLPNVRYKKKGYTFTGWSRKAKGKSHIYRNRTRIKSLTSKNKGTVVLYARWKKRK